MKISLEIRGQNMKARDAFKVDISNLAIFINNKCLLYAGSVG